MKNKFKDILKKVLNVLKVVIFSVVMVMGFWVIYDMIWLGCGFTDDNWAMWLLACLSIVSARLFLWWL
jgi:hypothetical protein